MHYLLHCLMHYLTGVSNPMVRAVARKEGIGLLVTPDTGYLRQIPQYPFHAADNGCFNHPERSVDDFLRWLKNVPIGLFATAPDVVGDAQRTLERSLGVLPLIRDLGWPVAFVAQDGIEQIDVPWSEFDVLFLGGSTAFKLGPVAHRYTRKAKSLGKKVHMGRVNSWKRMKLAWDWGCDTVDGTYLAFGPAVNLPKLLSWIHQLGKEPQLTLCGLD